MSGIVVINLVTLIFFANNILEGMRDQFNAIAKFALENGVELCTLGTG